jgi:prepilin-type N-terminal cleavage/methylation domain-containing protein
MSTMMTEERVSGAREKGLSLIELVVVIVLLGILAVGFMAMYANVTGRNAMRDQIAPMTWVGQGVMEAELLQTELGSPSPPFTVNQTFGPYQAVATWSTTATTPTRAGTYYAYLVTVTVTCVSGSCPTLTFTAHVYTT